MKKNTVLPVLALLGGAAALALRAAQNQTGFEPDTGLPVPGNLFALLLPLLLAGLAAVTLLAVRRLPAEKGEEESDIPVSVRFSSDGTLPRFVLALGIYAWFLSGAYGLFRGVSSSLPLELVLGVLSMICAACLFPLLRASRRGGNAQLRPGLLLAPVVCLVVRLVLIYRTVSINPTLAAYYPQLLALAALILTGYRLSSFAYRCGQTRRFALYAVWAVVLCMACLGDLGSGLGLLTFHAGGTLIALGLLLLRLDALGAAEGPAAA